MISHVFIGVTDFERAFAFYAPLMATLGQPLRFRDDEVQSEPVRVAYLWVQGNDVGADFLKHLKHAVRVAPPVNANRLAHVVAGDGDGARAHGCATAACSRRFLKRPGSRRSAHCPG